MKTILAWSAVILMYIALFWAIPIFYMADATGWTWWSIVLMLHAFAFGFCGLFGFIVWLIQRIGKIK